MQHETLVPFRRATRDIPPRTPAERERYAITDENPAVGDYPAQPMMAQSRGRKPVGSFLRQGISAAALMTMQFDPINYVVPGYIAEGLTVLAGSPKIGKSWWALGVGIAVAAGRPAFGSIAVEQGDVLYLALEDNRRRLKRRLLKMGVTSPPDRLTVCTEWPSLDEGCLDEINAWIASVDRPLLIVVDVLTKVRGAANGKDSAYEADYRTLTGLQMIAGQHGLAIVVVHHTRKMEAEDPFDSVSGTRGLTGAADTVLVLKRDSGTPRTTLYGRGRDIEEIETAFEFERDSGTWRVVGAAHEVAKTDERQIILDTLREAGKPLSAREVSDLTGKSYETIRRTMTRMVHSEEIERKAQGQYTCPTCPTVPPAAHPAPSGTGGTAFRDSDDFDPFDDPSIGAWT